jgi:hypothetical protein
MSQPDTRITHAQKVSRAQEVEQQLEQIRNANRLAIHITEAPGSTMYANFITLGKFNTFGAKEIPDRFFHLTPWLHSLTYLPPAASRNVVRPYGVTQDRLCNYGYLINLSTTQPNPPRVARVSELGLTSGDHEDRKEFRLSQLIRCQSHEDAPDHVFDRELLALYVRMAGMAEVPPLKMAEHPAFLTEWKNKILTAMSSSQGLDYSNEQLDILASYYTPPENSTASNTHSYNEVLASFTGDHIAAIVVPFNKKPYSRHEAHTLDDTYYKARIRLQAALVGLDHIRNGITGHPVVMYHVSKPDIGKIEFVGQTQRELETVALQSLVTIGNSADYLSNLKETKAAPSPEKTQNPYRAFSAAIQSHFGFEIVQLKPHGLNGWVDRAKHRLQKLAVTETEPSL